MLELTLTTGTELKIGEDIRIVFRGGTTGGRMKVAVEAPEEKRIERINAPEEEKKCGKMIIVKGDGNLSEGKRGQKNMQWKKPGDSGRKS